MARALRFAFALLILPLIAPIGAHAAAWSNNLELPAAAPLVDEANLLSEGETAQLSEILRTIKARSGVEVSVFIASSLRERPIEDLSLAVAEKWGLGTKKVDKGLLFLVAPNEKKMRFEVGYGLEGDITDAFSRQVLDNRVRPLFREGRYYEGILSGIQGIQEKVPLGLPEEQAPPRRRGGGGVNFIFFLLIVVFMVMGFISRLLGGGGSRRGGFGGPFIGGGGGGFGGGGGGGGWGGGGGGFGGGGSSSSW